MPKNFARKTYDHWIKKNLKRFKYPPYIIESRKDSFTLGFSGVINNITCNIRKNGMGNIYFYDDKDVYWDILFDLDLFDNKNKDGKYYCTECLLPEYYDTRALLWENHIFESMLEWINKLNIGSQICLWGKPFESSWGAELFNDININKQKKEFEHYKNDKECDCFSVLM